MLETTTLEARRVWLGHPSTCMTAEAAGLGCLSCSEHFSSMGGGCGLGTRSPGVWKDKRGQCRGQVGAPEDTRHPSGPPNRGSPRKMLPRLPGVRQEDDHAGCPLLGLQGTARFPVTLEDAVPSLGCFLPCPEG